MIVAMNMGGSGKTATVVNLAAVLAGKGKRNLVVDLDPDEPSAATACTIAR